MKQLLQSYRTGELWLAEVPSPQCINVGVKVKVISSLVSAGTEKRMIDLAKSNLLQKAKKRPDQVTRVIQKIKTEGIISTLQQVNAKLDTPVPLGYSAAGIIIELGENAAELNIGQKVLCAGAGYANHAEIITVPKNLVVPLPENLSFEEGAFGVLGAIAMQAVRQANIQVGEYVGVIGLGLLGNLTVQILNASGCRVVGTDLDSKKLTLAKGMGAELVGTNITELANRITGGQGLDKIIIAAGSSSSEIIKTCPSALRQKGRIVVLGFIGMECPHQEFYEKELELVMSMSYGPGRYDSIYEEEGVDYPYAYVRWSEQRNMESFLSLVSSKKINVSNLITHRFDFMNALKSYELIQDASSTYLGIILNYEDMNDNYDNKVKINEQNQADNKALNVNKLALVGAGSFGGGIIAPIIKKLKIPIKYVVTSKGASAINIAKKIGSEFATTSLEDVLNDNSVTHVILATRHFMHTEQAIKILSTGKVLHVEKPLSVNIEQLNSISSVVAELKAQNRIMIGFNRRFSPISKILLEELRQKPDYPLTISYRINAGELKKDHWFYDDPGGRLIAEGCHFIDYCLFVVGKPVTNVNCLKQGDKNRPFDSFIVTLGFSDGSQATILYSSQGDRALDKERVEIFQGAKCFINNNWSKLIKYEKGKIQKVYSNGQSKGWKEEMEHFFGIKTFYELAPSWEEIIYSHKIVFTAINTALGKDEKYF